MMRMANNQSVFWKWNTSLLKCDNACCAVHSFVIHTRSCYLSKCVLVTEYIFSRVSTGEGPPVGGEYPASEGLVVMH